MCLAEGIESSAGGDGVLLKHQLCTVTSFQYGIYLTRKSDGGDLGYFKVADLAAAAGGGTLLHLSLELKLIRIVMLVRSCCCSSIPCWPHFDSMPSAKHTCSPVSSSLGVPCGCCSCLGRPPSWTWCARQAIRVLLAALTVCRPWQRVPSGVSAAARVRLVERPQQVPRAAVPYAELSAADNVRRGHRQSRFSPAILARARHASNLCGLEGVAGTRRRFWPERIDLICASQRYAPLNTSPLTPKGSTR